MAYGFIKHNRFYTTDNTIMVMDASKNLNIEFATFRDKTEPGAKEKWQIKIADNKGKNVAAELLTAMYAAQGHKLRDDWLGVFDRDEITVVGTLPSIDDESAAQIEGRVARFREDGAALSAGLRGGEAVIAIGAARLVDGQAVQAKPATPPARQR